MAEYYVLLKRDTPTAAWRVVEGDHDRNAVVAKVAVHQKAYMTHILAAQSDDQANIDAAVAEFQ